MENDVAPIVSIGVVGGGAWGTALAITARRAGCDVLLWAYEMETIREINSEHQNRLYLPGVEIDPAIRATASLEEIAARDAVLLAAPAQNTRAVGAELGEVAPDGLPVVLCAKGLEQATGKLLSDVIGEVTPQARPAVLSGPSFAAEVARGLPCAVTLATRQEGLGQRLAHALRHTTFRPYWSNDILGAELGGAVKNVLAIAAGIVEGKGLGASAHAALVTRGFAEMQRFALALGARRETLTGLSGLGDLVLTCSSRQSRNMSLGRALGQGETLADILGGRRSVSEGVHTAAAIVKVADDNGLDMPICAAVRNVVSGETTVDEAIEALMTRPLRSEI